MLNVEEVEEFGLGIVKAHKAKGEVTNFDSRLHVGPLRKTTSLCAEGGKDGLGLGEQMR